MTATDDSGSVSYAKQSGDAWISVNTSTGALTGTAPGTAATYSITVRAEDPAGNFTDRTFDVVVETSDPVYLETDTAGASANETWTSIGTLDIGEPAFDRVILIVILACDNDYNTNNIDTIKVDGINYGYSSYRIYHSDYNNDGYPFFVTSIYGVPYPNGSSASIDILFGNVDFYALSVFAASGFGTTDLEAYQTETGQYDSSISRKWAIDRKTLAILTMGELGDKTFSPSGINILSNRYYSY